MSTIDLSPPPESKPRGQSPRLQLHDAGQAGTWLAVALALQPLLLTVNAAFHPDVDIDGASFLDAVRDGPNRWYVVHFVAALGAALWIPAAFGLRRLVGEGYRRLAGFALVTLSTGAALLALGFAIEGSVFRLIARADVDEAAALTLSDDYLDTAEFFSILPGFGLAVVGVWVLTGILLHERSPVRWLAVVYAIGFVVSAVSPPGSPIGPVALVVVAGAAVAMARDVRTS